MRNSAFYVHLLTSIVILTLQCAIAQKANTQFVKDSLLAIEYFNIADTSYLNVPKCLHYTQLAIPLLRRTNQVEKYQYCLNALNYCFEKLERFEELESSNNFAYQEAIRLLPETHPLRVGALNNLANVYKYLKQDFSKARAYYIEALRLFEEAREDSLSINIKGTLYQNLGQISNEEGDFDASADYLKKAIQLFEKDWITYLNKKTPTHLKLSDIRQNLARVYHQRNRNDEALQLMKEALTYIEGNRNANDGYYVQYYTFLGEILTSKREFEKAEQTFNSLKRKYQLTPDLAQKLVIAEGQLAFSSGKPKKAETLFREALVATPVSRLVTKAQINRSLANCSLSQNKLKAALVYCDNAIKYLGAEKQVLTGQKIDGHIVSKIELAKTLILKTKIQTALSKTELGVANLQLAVRAYLLISSLTDQIRLDYRSQESKLYLQNESAAYYESAIRTAKQLYDLTCDEQYLHTALFFSEKSKAAVLLDELQQREAAGKSSLPPALVERNRQFRIDLNFYQKLLDLEKKKPSPDKVKTETWESKLFNLHREQERLTDSLKQLFPDYFNMIESKPISTTEIQQELQKSGSTLIEYFFGQETAFAFKLTGKSIELVELSQVSEIECWTNQLLAARKLQNSHEIRDYTEAAVALHGILLLPLKLSSGDRLVIVPDGPLSYLPFEALLLKTPSNLDVKNWPYLFREHPISYGWSATLFFRKQAEKKGSLMMLGIAPIFEGTQKHLKYSDNEMESIIKYGGKVVIGNNASSKWVLENASKYDVLHLSTHATSQDSLLGKPAFEMADEPLYFSDLQTLQLNAKMVVLSACETSTGTQRKGEGVMSLARGFAYAGVPSIIATLWAVNEKATADILSDYYRNLEKGQTKDSAIENAKIEYLQTCSDHKAAPYYWAAITLVGNPEAINIERPFNYWGLVTAIFILALISFLHYNSKKNPA